MSLDFFQWFGGFIYAVSFLLLIINTVESRAAGEYVNLSTVFSSIYKGFFMLVFSRPLVIYAFDFARLVGISLVEFLSKGTALSQIPQSSGTKGASNIFSIIFSKIVPFSKDIPFVSFFESLFSLSSPIMSFITIIMVIFTIIVFFQLLTLYGMLYVQIVTGYLYIPDIMRGDVNAGIEWTRDVVASAVTFLLEFIFYIAGFAIMDANSLDSLTACAPGLILIIASPAIPTALRKWGYSHGGGSARGVVQSFGSAATGALSAITHI